MLRRRCCGTGRSMRVPLRGRDSTPSMRRATTRCSTASETMRGRPGRGCPRRLPGCWRSTNRWSARTARRASSPGGSTPAWRSATRCWSGRSKSSFPSSRWSSSAGGMRAGTARRSAPWGAGASSSGTSATRTTSRHSAAGRRSSARSSASSAPPSWTTCRRGSWRRARPWTTASGRPAGTASSCRSTREPAT